MITDVTGFVELSGDMKSLAKNTSEGTRLCVPLILIPYLMGLSPKVDSGDSSIRHTHPPTPDSEGPS